MLQDVVWATSMVLMGLLAVVFLWVALTASPAVADYGPMISSAYRLRLWLFGVAVIVLIAANYRTLGELPYVSAFSAPSGGPVQPVNVVGQQWQWSISPANFAVGQTAEFHVTSKDVNHGFALYDPSMRIVAETQAMPGYTNVLRYTFTHPGHYQVLCLEYCGLDHHVMKSDINVAAR